MMEKIRINLLPIEFTKLQVEQLKFKKVQTTGVVVILALAVLSVSTFALRFLQSRDISTVKDQLKQTEQQIQSFRPKEISLTILRDRLNTITNLTSTPSKQRSIYSLISSLTPQTVVINSIVVDKNANVVISVVASDSTFLSEYLQNLINPAKNENQIAQVIVDSLTRNKDGSFRASLKVRPK